MSADQTEAGPLDRIREMRGTLLQYLQLLTDEELLGDQSTLDPATRSEVERWGTLHSVTIGHGYAFDVLRAAGIGFPPEGPEQFARRLEFCVDSVRKILPLPEPNGESSGTS